MMEVVLGPIPSQMAAGASSGVRDLFKRRAQQGQPAELVGWLCGRRADEQAARRRDRWVWLGA